jgi:hypothetical protein
MTSSHHQGDTSQLVTSSPYERLGKVRRKAKASEKQSLESNTARSRSTEVRSAQKAFPIRLAKEFLHYACSNSTMIIKAQNQAEAKA